MPHLFEKPARLKIYQREELTAKLFAATGEWAVQLIQSVPHTDPLAFLSDDARAEAAMAVAREVLLLPPARRREMLERFPSWANCRPLADLPSLGALQDKPAAIALYPLADPLGNAPEIGLCLAIGRELRCQTESGGVQQGDSDGLARALASHVAREGNSEEILRLASRWICSARLGTDGNSLHPVEIGNKTELVHRIPARNWLLAGGQETQFPPQLARRKAPTLDDAIRIVKQRGIVEGEELDWSPYAGCVLHTFTSRAVEPVILACMLARPREVILWSSRDSIARERAEWLQEWLPRHLGIHVPQPLAADDQKLAVLDRQIREWLEPALEHGETVLFNITQGSLLMRAAPFLLAREHANLHLIYHGIGLGRPEFERIHFPDGEPVNQRLVGNEGDPRVNWQALYKDNAKDRLAKTDYERALFPAARADLD